MVNLNPNALQSSMTIADFDEIIRRTIEAQKGTRNGVRTKLRTALSNFLICRCLQNRVHIGSVNAFPV